MAQGFTPQDWLGAIYVAYWGRAADPEGLDYWVNMWDELDEDGRTKEAAWFASNFAASEEAASAYAYFAAYQQDEEITEEMREEFIDAIYANLFNREPDEDGKAYWLEQLETGTVDPGEFIATIVHSALEAGGEDAATITAKKDVAQSVTDRIVELELSGENVEIYTYFSKEIITETTLDNVAEQKEQVENLPVPGGDEVMISLDPVIAARGDEFSVPVSVTNMTGEDLEKTLDLLVWDEDDPEKDLFFDEVENFQVPAGESAEHTFSFYADVDPGVYFMDAAYADQDIFYISDAVTLTIADTKTQLLGVSDSCGAQPAVMEGC